MSDELGLLRRLDYKCLLRVKDNTVNQKVTLDQLKNLGYPTDVVANGQEALQMMEKIPYNLMLMDCQMPILDSYQATQEIRQLEEAPNLLLALTESIQAVQEFLDAAEPEVL